MLPWACSKAEGIAKAVHQHTLTAEARGAQLSVTMLCPIRNLKSQGIRSQAKLIGLSCPATQALQNLLLFPTI